MSPLLKLRDLRVRYGRVSALEGVSLEVHSGEIVSVIGANGAGKSTTLLSVSGDVQPTSGQIVFENESIVSLAPEKIVERGVSLVPEGRRIFGRLTVAENLRLGATTRRDRASVRRHTDDVLTRFPVLGKYFRSPAGRLSGGEQQQLAIGRALLSRPKLMLLDEPSLGLAPLLVERVFEVLQELRQEGMTILLVEQFAERARELADRAYVLRNGRVVLEMARGDSVTRSEFEAAYFGFQVVRQQ